jgi:hypothetical protein
MSISNRRVLLLSLILIPTTAFAIVLELESLDLVVVYTNCACYPGITTWGYVLQALAAFVFLDSALLLLWFWRIIAGPAMWLLALVDFIAYVSAFFLAAGSLSTTHPTSYDPLVFVVPMFILFGAGYLFKRFVGSYQPYEARPTAVST